jgi:uncharacterized protein (DUF2147 family)
MIMMYRFFGIALLVAFFSVNAIAQASAPVGIWKTIDDGTGEAKSHVEIYEQDGKYHGKVVKLLSSPSDRTCDECTGEKKGKPILGMVILEDLQTYKDYWKKGTIMDPENGKEYKCSVWFEENNDKELKVRGHHWTGLYRTQTWYRVK